MGFEPGTTDFGRRGRERARKAQEPITPEEHEAAAKGKDAQRVLDAAGPLYFDVRKEALLKEAFLIIKADKAIAPAIAVRILTQLYEHDQVLRDFTAFVAAGNKAQERITSFAVKNP